MPRRCVTLLTLIACTIASTGCGGGDPNAVNPNDPVAVETAFQKKARKHHPTEFSEIELGEFFVVHQKGGKGVLFLRFQLFGVLPNEDQPAFSEALVSHKKRMNEAVVQTIMNSDRITINDPRFKFVRGKLVENINRAMNTDTLRDVVFTQLSIARG